MSSDGDVQCRTKKNVNAYAWINTTEQNRKKNNVISLKLNRKQKKKITTKFKMVSKINVFVFFSISKWQFPIAFEPEGNWTCTFDQHCMAYVLL